MRTCLLFILCFITSLNAKSQVDGEIRSTASGTWEGPNWERFSDFDHLWHPTSDPSSADKLITILAVNTITMTTSHNIDQLIVDGGLIQNAAMTVENGPGIDMIINGRVEFAGTGTTIQPGAVVSLIGIFGDDNTKVVTSLINNGTFNFKGNFLNFDGGTFVNNSTFNATGNIQSGNIQSLFNFSTGTFTNNGVFNESTATGNTTNYINFTNNGTMNFNSGTFVNNNSFSNANTLNFTGGTFENLGDASFNAGTSLTGNGNITNSVFGNLNINLNLVLPASIGITFNDGNIICTGNLTIAGIFQWNGGQLQGPGNLTISGNTQWNAGRLNVITTIETGVTVDLAVDLSGAGAILNSTLTNKGTINWATQFLTFDGGTLINRKNFNATGSSQSLSNNSTGTFTNTGSGVFTELTGTGSTINNINFTNNGTMNFQSGTFVNNNSFINARILNFIGGAFQNSADGSFNAGTSVTGNGGNIINELGTLHVNLALTLPNSITLVSNSGNIAGTGSLTINGNMNWSGGELRVNSTLQTSGVINLSDHEQILFSTLTNNGTVNWNSDFFSFNGGTLINNNSLNLISNGTLYNYGGGSVSNAGVVSKTSTGTTTVNIPFTNSGIIKGVGIFDFGANLTNNGTFAPGNSPGILTTGTDYINNTLQIEMLNGSGAGTGHDKLTVNGNAQLQGTLNILITGIVPVGSYTILSSTGNITGNFSNITAPDGLTVSKVGTTIVVDVAKPVVSIANISRPEGKKEMNFTVRLSYASNLTTKVDYQTFDSTATVADNDYAPKSGTLTFAPGELTKTISIKIDDDAVIEPDEVFYIKLSNPVKLTIKKNRGKGIGTIINDDGSALMAINRSTIDEKQTADKLIVPNFIHRNQRWSISGLSGLNATITIVDEKGSVALKLNNYQNSADLSMLTPGLYFYQVLYKDTFQKSKIVTGKLVVAD